MLLTIIDSSNMHWHNPTELVFGFEFWRMLEWLLLYD